jgi:hypothetical protein
MRASCLSVGGLPMCGIVGDGDTWVSPDDVWMSYGRFVNSIAEGRPVSVLPAAWDLNGKRWDRDVLPFTKIPAPYFLRIRANDPHWERGERI